jgi:AraC-like DNA-binding protein
MPGPGNTHLLHRPDVLPERLGVLDSPVVDALSAVLRVIKLDSAVFFHAEFSEPWCLLSPETRELRAELTRHSGHVIIYHLLCEGRASAELLDGTRVALVAGDLITFPHGDAHRLGSGETPSMMSASDALRDFEVGRLSLVEAGGGGARARFICGFLACDPRLGRAFLGGLPPVIRVNLRDDPAGQWLENSLRFSVNEAATRGAGSDAMLAKLSEALFAETVRRYVRQLPEDETGWLAGARDPELGRALTLIHSRPAEPWTAAELARQAGMSRSVLAERFRHFLGESPMAYLTRWRLVLGARAVTSTSLSVAQVALDVGYESEAAFNRAFKREFGLPPARYRREKAMETRTA